MYDRRESVLVKASWSVDLDSTTLLSSYTKHLKIVIYTFPAWRSTMEDSVRIQKPCNGSQRPDHVANVGPQHHF